MVQSAGRTVTFTGNGVTSNSPLSGTTDSAGKATVTVISPNTINTGWIYQAHFAGDNTYNAADSTTMAYNTVKRPTSLTMEFFPPTGCVSAGGRFDVGDDLTDKTQSSITLVGRTISLLASSPIKLGSQITDSSGGYSVTGLTAPTTAGSYKISAQFLGDPLYDVSGLMKILTVTPGGATTDAAIKTKLTTTPTTAAASSACPSVGPIPPKISTNNNQTLTKQQ